MSTVESNPHAAMRDLQTAVPWTAVRLDDPFWAPRVRVVRERTLPALYRQCLDSGRIDALRLGWLPGQRPVPHRFWDSDIAKFIEACSYSLALHPDAWLESRVEEIVDLLGSAQQSDGYLNTYMTQVEPQNRWTDLRDGHELYCAGHLIEAGVAHFAATGRRDLLDVVARYADYIASVFGRGPGHKRGYCGHPEIELALVRLYRATGERRFLDLSWYFVDERGREPYYFDSEASERTRPRASDSYYRRHGLSGLELRRYNQSHAPVRDQTDVVGHAVRAMYLCSAMADLARETSDETMFEACDRLWRHLVSRRMYITGGIGSSAHNEGFTTDFDLPNDTAYAESCAAVGLVFWAHRMLQLTGDGRYADAMENVLYNAVAAAMSLDGDHFFYANPLASDGRAHRQPWFRVACCPPNVARLMTSLGQYIYSVGVGGSHLAIHLYVRGQAQLEVAGQRLCIRQTHDYPWDGHIRFELQMDRPAEFGLWVRLPGWSRGASLFVNDEVVDIQRIVHNGYARLERTWTSGDEVRLELGMPAERMYAHPAVAADAGRVALRRGPLVYCVEQVDHAVPLNSVVMPEHAELCASFDANLLGGVTVIRADALASDGNWDHQLYRETPPGVRPTPLVAVPYAVWDNRTEGDMQVWIRDAPNA
jgi:DUF1680 family protein